MLMLSFVLGSVLISGIFANVKEDVETCGDNHLDTEVIENMDDNLPSAKEIEILCPMILGFIECAENAVQKETGMSVEEIKESMPDPVMKDTINVYINVRSIIRDTCTEGSDLNRAYIEHGSCLSTVELKNDACRDSAIAAYETYKELDDSLEEPGERDCMMTAYMSACLASEIHEKCGRAAFDFYQQVVKRSSFFRLALCSERGLENMKNKFLNTLELEDERHDLFSLAFDLRKRRK